MIKLRKHQEEVLKQATGKNFGLFWGCGSGKSIAGLALYQENKKLKHNLKLLVVVSPKELIQSAWMNDCDKVGLTDYKSLKDIKDFKSLPDIILTNYEYIRVTKNLLQLKTAIRNSGYPWMLVLDESSKIKNPKTTNFKTIKHISPLCCYRYVMSGTPAPNSETEYWTQMNIISEQPFGKNYYQFRREYFEFTKEYKGKIYKADPEMLRNPAMARGYLQQGYKYTLDPKKKESFFAVMKPWVSRLETRDVVDLPAETHMERYFSLSPKEKLAYKQMRTEMIATVEDKEDVVATDSVLGKMLKLRQVSSGFMYDNTDINNKKCYEFGTSKLNCLMDLLEDIGNNQVVIWATFRQEAEMICKELDKLGKTYTTLNAGTKDKQKAIQDFAENKVQYVIANPQTAAHGITWTNCQYEVFYSMDYSWERYHQAVARIMRLGQTKPCFYYYLLAKGTKDKGILDVIKRKGSLNEIAKEMLK